MEPLAAVLAIIAVFLFLAAIIARVDGLAFLAPASTRGIAASAEVFCAKHCRVNQQCPLTQGSGRAPNCALFKYIAADLPTEIYGSPFESLRA